MGKEDLYPFVLAPAVIDKLSFVHDLVQKTASKSLHHKRTARKATAGEHTANAA
jgi:hypothetical protein